MTGFRVYTEVHDPVGPLDAVERAAAVTICDCAWYRSDAKRLLAMCGLLRKGGQP